MRLERRWQGQTDVGATTEEACKRQLRVHRGSGCGMKSFRLRPRPAGWVWNVSPDLQGLQDVIPYRDEAHSVIRPVIKRQQHLDIATDANGNTPIGLAEFL